MDKKGVSYLLVRVQISTDSIKSNLELAKLQMHTFGSSTSNSVSFSRCDQFPELFIVALNIIVR